jgi:chaperone required for assembly of F1-ATPase
MRDLLNDLEADNLLSDPDPVRRAQNQMRSELPRRFYKDVSIVPVADGFAIQLDARSARTPARAVMVVPTDAVAKLVAGEFGAQEDVINPVSMPAMRLANTAIDGVAREADAVAEDILRFASSDLLCYRADGPEGLVQRQNEQWDPVLDWVAEALGGRFSLAEGIVHVAQPPAAMAAIRLRLCASMEPFRLAALHLLTSLSGSALLALAVDAGRVSPEEAWKAAHVDEDWQIEHWGQDAEAVARRNARWRDFAAAAAVLKAL